MTIAPSRLSIARTTTTALAVTAAVLGLGAADRLFGLGLPLPLTAVVVGCVCLTVQGGPICRPTARQVTGFIVVS